MKGSGRRSSELTSLRKRRAWEDAIAVSARNKHRMCAYCGKIKKSTVDHVPPKLLLEQPFPPNLLTVPACEDCNQSFKADDEYTRTVLAMDISAAKNKAAQFNLPAIMRWLENPKAAGFAKYLDAQSEKMDVLSADGLPMARIGVDKERVNNTGLHIMRGLYFLEKESPIPHHARVRLESKAGLTPSHPDMVTIARVFHVCRDRRDGAIGNAFSYMAAFNNQGWSAWVMLLYEYFFWVGTIDEREVAVR